MILLLLVGCLPLSWAELQGRLVEPPLRVEMPPPPPETEESSRNVFQSWMTMPIDHFDPQNSDTFLMRFMFNEEFFVQDGSPIFILVGGEWAINAGWLRAGNMYDMARENGGYQIYTEHRYYGLTQPFAELTVENLRFLNVDQALADLARFIGELKKIPRFENSKVILYGGSYAANMVLWFKQRYPHLVTGGVASSGPIKGEVDFTGYLEVVYEAFLSEGGEQCIDHIRRGIDATIEALKTEEGRELIDDAYRLCQPRRFDFDDRFDLGYFSGLITWSFSSSVQSAFPGSLRAVCNNFANNAYGSTPMSQIGGYIASVQGLGATSCWALSYESYVESLSQLVPTVSRAWYYQTCLEYGYYQTAPRSGTPFDALQWLSVEWYVDVCKRAFDERFDEQFVRNAVERTNTYFGGLDPDVNNTINIHGAIDPWKALGVRDRDLTDSSPTFYVPRASHCFDMQSWGITDTILMTGVQQNARRIVASWLSDQTN